MGAAPRIPTATGSATPGTSATAAASGKSRRPGHRYKLPGTYVVHVTVMDRRKAGLTDATTLVVNVGNTAPTIGFTQPVDGTSYAVGDVLPIVIAATDAEDGPLGGAAVTWQVLLHHLGHLHYLPLVHGASGSFQVPDHGDDSHLSIVATATDSLGAKVTTEVTLVPRTVTVSVLGSPSGVQALVDGQPRTTPYVWQSIVGGSHSVTAPSPQTLGGTSYGFASWSDGLATDPRLRHARCAEEPDRDLRPELTAIGSSRSRRSS